MAGSIAQRSGKSKGLTATQAVTFGTTPAAGNAIIVIAWLFSGLTGNATFPTGGCADNKGNTYTRAYVSGADFGSSGISTACYYSANIASSATFTVTVTPTPANAVGAIVMETYECAGLLTSGILDQTATNAGTTGTTYASGTTATTSQADELAFSSLVFSDTSGTSGVAFTQNGSGSNPASGWVEELTETDNNGSMAGDTVSRVLTATGAIAHVFGNTNRTTNGWNTGIATFKAAAASGTLLRPPGLSGGLNRPGMVGGIGG